LPLPALAEIIFEGELLPSSQEMLPEGPFGEFTGYYGRPGGNAPYLKIEAHYHRNKPIHTAAMMADKPGANDLSVYQAVLRSAKIWSDMEAAGVPGIKGIWTPPCAAGAWGMTVVSIKQMYAGHAQQAAMVAAGCAGGAYYTKFHWIVDDDIDPTNMDEVLWAAASRCRCSEDIEIFRNTWSTGLDPSKNPPEDRPYGSKVFIFACKQHKYLNSYSKRSAMTKEAYDNACARWKEVGMPGEPPIISFFDDMK
jgi:4-hydroxy-3-polyprenylbenzoate decarboxylase